MPSRPSDNHYLPVPAISVVICAFTTERLGVMDEAIDSVRAQTLSAHEIVLVIDHAPELLEISRARWPDLRIVENRETTGVSGARNTGIAETTCDVVAFLDDDAIADSEWLQRLADSYRERHVLGVGGTVRPRWTHGRPRWFPAEFDWVVGCTHSGMPRERSGVRNLVGANSSFRRDVLIELGGFRPELGRVRALPIGCEETDLCIRVSERWPNGLILYDPAVRVDQVVPPARARPRYFVERCVKEGRSKALLARLVGSRAGLSAERSYVRRTLPLGFARGLRDALRGDLAGAARSGALVVGLLATTLGYVQARGLLGRAAVRNRSGPEPGGERLRVLMVTPRTPLAQGGVERHVMEVSRRIGAAARVEVLCTHRGPPALTEKRRDGVVIRSVRAWPAKADYRLAPRIWREMAREPWDLVHVQSYHTMVAPLAMLRALVLRIPYIVTFHGGGHSSRLRNRLRRAQRRVLRPLLARAERLVAVAAFEIDQYGRELRLPPERFVLIPNGTELASSRPVSDEDPAAPPVLASIGRLERYKGHHRVIAALPHVLEQHPDASLLVVGNGPYESALRQQAAALGLDDHVEFTSVPHDDPSVMAALLGRVSLVVLLSEFETHPLVALEAAAAGRRLLVADRAGLGELAAGGLARAVSPDEPPATIADAILEELERPVPTRAPRLTSWHECASELIDLYGSLIRANPPRPAAGS